MKLLNDSSSVFTYTSDHCCKYTFEHFKVSLMRFGSREGFVQMFVCLRGKAELCPVDTGSCESSAKEQLKNHLLIKHRSQGSMAETEEPEQRSSPLQSSHQHRESAKAASLDRTSPRHHTTEHHRKTSSTHHTENSISSRSNHEVLSVSSTNASTSASASERKTQKPAPKLTSVSSIEMPTMLQIPAQVPPG